jgi:hypothetical protein
MPLDLPTKKLLVAMYNTATYLEEHADLSERERLSLVLDASAWIGELSEQDGVCGCGYEDTNYIRLDCPVHGCLPEPAPCQE